MKICERRIEKLKRYAKAATDEEKALIENARIIKKENYVILLISSDNARLEKKIFSLI